MRQGKVYRNGIYAGMITEDADRSYQFEYDSDYYADAKLPPISLTLPKSQKTYQSEILFPFFFNLLSEGVNRKVQSKTLRIDENDHFGLLLATANTDTIGAITIEPLEV